MFKCMYFPVSTGREVILQIEKQDLDPDALGREIYKYIRRSPIDHSLPDRNILGRFCTRCDPVCFESIRRGESEQCPDVVLELVMEKLNCIKLK